MSPAVSVIMPAFNRANWLPLSIGSVQRQSFADWELIVIDDRSTDATPQVVRNQAGVDNRIRLVPNQHTKGPSGARNQGLEVARGKYIAYLDSDDEWEPFHLGEMVNYLEAFPDQIDVMTANPLRKRRATGEVFNYDELDPDSTPHRKFNDIWLLDPERLFDTAIRQRVITTQTLVGKREIVSGVCWDELVKAGTDCLYLWELAARRPKVGHVQRYHVTYWAHDDNLTDCNGGHDVERRIRLHEAFAGFFETALSRLPLTAAQRARVSRAYADHLFWNLGYNGHLAKGNRPEALKAFWKAIRVRPFALQYWKTALLRTLIPT